MHNEPRIANEKKKKQPCTKIRAEIIFRARTENTAHRFFSIVIKTPHWKSWI